MALLNPWGQPQQQASQSPSSLLSMLAEHRDRAAWNAASPRRYYAANPMAWISNQGPPIGVNFQGIKGNPLGEWSSAAAERPIYNPWHTIDPQPEPQPQPAPQAAPNYTPYNAGQYMPTQRTGRIRGGMDARGAVARFGSGVYEPIAVSDPAGLNKQDPRRHGWAPDPFEGATTWSNEQQRYLDESGEPIRSGYAHEDRMQWTPFGYMDFKTLQQHPEYAYGGYQPELGTAAAMKQYFDRRLQQERGSF